MRRLGPISAPIARCLTTHSQNPNLLSQSLKNLNLIDPNQSRTLHILIQRSDPLIPNRPWSHSTFARESTSTVAQEKKVVVATERVSSIVDELAQLTLLETMDLTDVLREKMGVEEMPSMGIMMPGMGFSVQGGGGGKGGGTKAAVEAKAEKTAFDLKLDGFDAAAKIKIIKEVRTFTDLGLKEAKDLVEKAPTLLKKGVPKEEAEKIIEKMKELGAKVSME